MDVISKENLTCDIYICVDKVADSLGFACTMRSMILGITVNYAYENDIKIGDCYIDIDSDIKRQELVTKLTTDSNKPDFILVYGDSHGLDQFGIQVIDVCKIRMMSHEKS